MEREWRSRFHRRNPGLRAWLLLAAGAIVALVQGGGFLDRITRPNPEIGGAIGGRARVADGDSLKIGAVTVRLRGIDAPELAQSCTVDGQAWPCGRVAMDHLERLIGSDEVSCEAARRDQYDRLLTVCRAGNRDLNRAMVRDGMAVAFGDRYTAEESRARAARAGLWRGDFERPGDWRRRNGGGRE